MQYLALLTLLVAIPALAQQVFPVKVITADTTLEKDGVLRTPLVIKADSIVIDGNGATIQGPGNPGDLKSFTGTGILAEGHSNVTIRDLKVRGFERGLAASEGEGWLIESCDFSGNYHDPDYGWGDYQRVGGIILTGISRSAIRKNKANNVWNGLDLRDSHDNTIENNDFSHCSNVCLKLWTACRNVVRDNNLSYGLRISPGEVHARDSTGVLIESGSNDNRFERNDVTHGGDGIFIRVLNGWVSAGNVFIENDCSYANNNGFEAWSPDNTYIRNKANHCSYGFWLGGSDHTVLIGNEAGYNGQPDGFHNAPESDFVHGGIVIVHGSGSHSIIDGNYCHHNNGAGIVFRGDLGTRGAKWKMYHLIVQNNRLEHNRWGIFGRFTDWLDLAGNVYKDNDEDEFFEEVTNLTRRKVDPLKKPAPQAVLEGPSRALVGETVSFDASQSQDAAGRRLEFRWDIGGTVCTGPTAEHVFREPGFYRVGLTVANGYLADLAFRDFYVAKPVNELATEGQAAKWGWTMGGNEDGRGAVYFANDDVAIVGRSSVRIRPDPYRGADVSGVFPMSRAAGWNLTDKKRLTFWLKFQNSNLGFQGPNPIVRLHAGRATCTYIPAARGRPRNLLGDLPYSEARHGWLYVSIPLAGGEAWLRSETFAGARPPHIDNELRFVTLSTPIATQNASALVSDGKHLYCAALDGDRLFRSENGRLWAKLKSPAADLGGQSGNWINGMLAFYPGAGEKGRLYLRQRDAQRDQHGHQPFKLVAYDLATDTWSWTPTVVAMGHGTTTVGGYLFGLAHALGGNFGGPACRVNLADPAAVEERTVLGPLRGKEAGWFSRAAQLAALQGKIYGIKNDWTTPQPHDADEVGDRLYAFDPADYAASKFSGGNLWNDKNWKASRTPAADLGGLRFEVGHGASLVALPPNWCSAVGKQGGLFIVAGCSPSDHEGYGPPSSRYAVYDVASGQVTAGDLPDTTGAGSSAALHNGKLYIKRGGMNYRPSNGELWVVTPLRAGEARVTEARLKQQQMNLTRVDYLSIQFDSWGYEPFSIWIDGLAFE
ncbi:MAG: right-handed parallel beta-helix repeat-containing protein [Phycisphaerae bacterium]